MAVVLYTDEYVEGFVYNVQHQIWQFTYGCLKQHACHIIHPTAQSIDICVYDLHTRVYQ